MAKSLLYQTEHNPHRLPPGCALGERKEVPVTVRKNGRLYRFILRDGVTVDDFYIMAVKAAAFAIQQREPYAAAPPSRSVRDFLIKHDVVI